MESGALAFGADWPGLFLRGDDSLHYAQHLRSLLAATEKVIAADPDAVGPEVYHAMVVLPNLVRKLQSVDVSDPLQKHVQLRSARECLASTPTMRGPGPEETSDAKLEIG